MNLKRLFSAARLYFIALIVSVAVLVIISVLAYRQIMSFQESSDLVAHTMEVEKQINRFFNNITMIRSAEQDYLLYHQTASLDLTGDYAQETRLALAKLRQLNVNNSVQQRNIEEMSRLRESFLSLVAEEIQAHEDKIEALRNVQGNNSEVAMSIRDMMALKNKMIGEGERTMLRRKAIYNSRSAVTPLATFGVLLFSLLVFALGFWKIIENRRKVLGTQHFLDNILASTSNIISHFLPIRNKDGTIVDFEIAYTNENIVAASGDIPSKIKGMPISKVHPYLFDNGAFEVMVECVEENKNRTIERTYEFLGKTKIFESTFIKHRDGLTVTSKDMTAERLASDRLKDFNRKLGIKNESLGEAESIAEIGSYRWNLKEGTIEFSDNLYRLLGHVPDAFPASFERYKTFVHPDDLADLELVIENSFRHRTGREQEYRIITETGKTKDVQSIERFINENGQNVLVGVVQDVTTENERKRHLIDQNLELKRSNDELASFTQVASHDLQEPLRKVETFISIIQENNKIDSDDIDFFEKIETSAGRMRTLIRNLLTYSAISKTHEDFVNVDLNSILEKVLEDQSIRVKDSNTKISIGKLPSIQGVPYQMEQLFNNLVSNAIKYGKKKGQPKVLITADKVHRKQLPKRTHKQFKNYLKITVIDNGIGFDPKQADKIFGVFQRLHQKNAYSGTGIGLSICKKIVQNHHGFITAMGTPDKGATFVIYLPTFD